MSKRVYLLTKEQVEWMRSAFTDATDLPPSLFDQDVRCATCRWWQDGWQCFPSEEVQLTAEATGGDYSTALSTDPNHACSMWHAAPEPSELTLVQRPDRP